MPNVRYHKLDDSVRLIEHAPRGSARLQPVPIGKRVVRFLKKHKRKFAIAGGALAVGGAIVGGLAGGIPIKEAKKEVLVYTDQSKKDMREGHSGTLARIVKGTPSYDNFGGGGGGGGGGVYAPSHSGYKRRRKTSPKRRIRKRQKAGKKRVKRIGGKKRKVARLSGINKRRRRVGKKKAKRFAAF